MLNLVRQTGIIPTDKLVEERVHILGVGAIGSHLALMLSKTGILDVTLWDSDHIESHNIPNQAFDTDMEGRNKAEAMAEIVKKATGLEYQTKGFWDGEELEGMVFSCVDSMETRKKILEATKSGIFIETRMGVYHGNVYAIRPEDTEQVKFWHSQWSGDDVIEEKSACGSSLTIGATAQLLSSIAAWQGYHFMRDEKTARGVVACVNPYLIQEL